MRLFAATLVLGSLAAVPALASGLGGDLAGPGIHIGIGGQLKPKYPGASETILSPYPIFQVTREGGSSGGVLPDNVSLYPSFSFMGERSAADSTKLTGTNSIDWAFEAGLGLRYEEGPVRLYGHVRQGFGGHSGQVAAIGADLVGQLDARTRYEIGPRLNWASEEYMDTYFGVTAAEAAAPGSVLTAFDPDGGFYSAGIHARISHDLTDRVRLHARASWERFIGDAADSPIVTTGSEDQFRVGAGVSYLFDGSMGSR